jgi:excinuclease ABC subunit B
LIQTIGRAARNSKGHVIMYADTITDSMKMAIDETARRREIQMAYNEANGITPKTIEKKVREVIAISKEVAKDEMESNRAPEEMSAEELEKLIAKMKKKMETAAADLNFEMAAQYRDRIIELKNMLREMQ